jgi:hypothetical protein
LVCHNNHSLVPTALMESGQDVPQLTHVTYLNSPMTTSERQNLDLAKLILTADQINLNLLQCITQIYQFIHTYKSILL